jgi:hypothetical protein
MTIFDNPDATLGERFAAAEGWAESLGWELKRLPPYGGFVLSKRVDNVLKMVHISYLGGVLSFLAKST